MATPEPVDRVARGRELQRELYGAPLGDRVRRLMGVLGVSQARVARALGISPAMLSQLVSARRVKIGDPAVLARLMVLDQRCSGVTGTPRPRSVDALLTEVAAVQWHWSPERLRERRQQPQPAYSPADALRTVSDPARLAAAAATLGTGFPELAEVLRQAACLPRRL